jgi:hypothetical protein
MIDDTTENTEVTTENTEVPTENTEVTTENIVLKYIELDNTIIEKQIEVTNESIIGDIVEKALSIFQLMIYNIGNIYINAVDVNLEINKQMLLNQKLFDIDKLTTDSILDITFNEIKRDENGNVISNKLPQIYNDYILFKEDKELARSYERPNIQPSYNTYTRSYSISSDNYLSEIDNILRNVLDTTNTDTYDELVNNVSTQFNRIMTNSNLEPSVSNTIQSVGAPVIEPPESTDEPESVGAPRIYNANNYSHINSRYLNNNVHISAYLREEPIIIPSVERSPVSYSDIMSFYGANEPSSNESPFNNVRSNIFNTFNSVLNNDIENEDVKVVAVKSELDNLSYITYKKLKEQIQLGDISGGGLTECSICIENFEDDDEILYTKCCHTFHKECINKWITEYNIKCPICKKDVTLGAPQL